MQCGKSREMVTDLKKPGGYRRKKTTLLNTEFLLSRLICLNLEYPLQSKEKYLRHLNIYGVRLACTERRAKVWWNSEQLPFPWMSHCYQYQTISKGKKKTNYIFCHYACSQWLDKLKHNLFLFNPICALKLSWFCC